MRGCAGLSERFLICEGSVGGWMVGGWSCLRTPPLQEAFKPLIQEGVFAWEEKVGQKVACYWTFCGRVYRIECTEREKIASGVVVAPEAA
jgi:hypothetical protein